MIETFIYTRSPFTIEAGWDSEVFYNGAGDTLTSERKCYEDALIRSGIVDLPFDSFPIRELESLCLDNGIYVLFLDEEGE